MLHFAIFGLHPRLSLAEFRALKPHVPSPYLAGSAAVIEDQDWNGEHLMNQLGGTVKLGDILSELTLGECTAANIADLMTERLDGSSIDFGWSVYGGSKKSSSSLEKLALPFKKELRARGISSRWVTSEGGDALSPAAVAKLKLTTQGLDICLLMVGERVFVGRTTHVQNADAWSKRDYGRPARDEVVGMLPPKLARMMVNLAQTRKGGTLLDPFCGGGTILMEAALATPAGQLIGSDVDAEQISNAQKNIAWLGSAHLLPAKRLEQITLFTSDVRQLNAKLDTNSLDAVVTEGYLGPPLSGEETQTTLNQNVEKIRTLWKETLKTFHPLVTQNGRIVGIWPSFKTSHGMARVDLTDELARLGYHLINPLEGWDDSDGPLLYSRTGQRVMRRIVVMEKI